MNYQKKRLDKKFFLFNEKLKKYKLLIIHLFIKYYLLNKYK